MKSTCISELPITPEYYDIDHYSNAECGVLHSEMAEEELRFISGLIRYYEPDNVLEIGVSRGGGTVNILNAISDRDAKLISIDKMEVCWSDETCKVGAAVDEKGVPTDKWQLITGADPSDVLEELNVRFDFCVIDTDHRHPVESLNFLCALPFLNDGAIVVIHDTALYLLIGAAEQFFASRILLMSVCAEKLEAKLETPAGCPNTIAFQVTQDTRKYIRNVFDSLMLPWETVPDNLEKIDSLISMHYSIELSSIYHQAVSLQRKLPFIKRINGLLFTTEHEVTAFDGWNRLGDDLIFYGAGRNMRQLLEIGMEFGWTFEYPIWDINAEQIGTIFDCPVNLPDFENSAKPNQRIVITIDDKRLYTQIRGQFVQLGYRVFHGLRELVEEIRNPSKRDLYIWNEMFGWEFPVEFTEEMISLTEYVESNELTLTSRDRIFATIKACQYVVENNIEGDFVECGVWRGGQALLAAGIFKQMGSEKRVWLYDTFEGRASIEPSSIDFNINAKNMEIHLIQADILDQSTEARNSIDNVKENFGKAGLLGDNVVFIKGDVMKTLSGSSVPNKVAVLRLDTNWYASTLKELQVLYPLLEHGGVLMIDDYGYCEGARTAVEEYFKDKKRPLLQIIDDHGRLAIKV